MIPSLAVMLRCLFDYDILDYGNAFIWTSIIGAGVLGIVLYTYRQSVKNDSIWGTVFIAVVIGGLHYFGLFFQVTLVNCMFDYSKPVVFQVEVLDKEIDDSDDSDEYELYVQNWVDSPNEEFKLTVKKSTYESVKVGGFVDVYEQKGLLNIPWYYIRE